MLAEFEALGEIEVERVALLVGLVKERDLAGEGDARGVSDASTLTEERAEKEAAMEPED